MNLTFNVQIKGDNNKDFRRILSGIGFGIEAEAKLLITGPKSGLDYRRRGRIHIASAPGEAPAVDTGFLINSIQTEVKSDTETVVAIAAEYAEGLEFGTDDIAERPFVRPAIDSVLKRFDSGGFLGASE
jgi:hypothetical protein